MDPTERRIGGKRGDKAVPKYSLESLGSSLGRMSTPVNVKECHRCVCVRCTAAVISSLHEVKWKDVWVAKGFISHKKSSNIYARQDR